MAAPFNLAQPNSACYSHESQLILFYHLNYLTSCQTYQQRKEVRNMRIHSLVAWIKRLGREKCIHLLLRCLNCVPHLRPARKRQSFKEISHPIGTFMVILTGIGFQGLGDETLRRPFLHSTGRSLSALWACRG